MVPMAKKKIYGASDYIIPLGIIGILGWIAYEWFISGNGTGTGQQSAAQNANVTAADAAAYNASAAQIPQSIPDTQINSMIGVMMSDAEENTSMFSGSSYQQDIITQMGQLGNITDLYRLIMLWGTRDVAGASGSICDLIDVDCTAVDFGTFIHATLSASQLQQLNQNLQNNGINYAFS
jgi:hypothetical protein